MFPSCDKKESGTMRFVAVRYRTKADYVIDRPISAPTESRRAEVSKFFSLVRIKVL